MCLKSAPRTKSGKTVGTQNHIFYAQDQLYSNCTAGGGAGELQLGQRGGDLGSPPTRHFRCLFSIFSKGHIRNRCVHKEPKGPGFWLLNAALYSLQEVARNWYDRFNRHIIILGFETVPGNPAPYNYKD